jgi:hypothetical protein
MPKRKRTDRELYRALVHDLERRAKETDRRIEQTIRRFDEAMRQLGKATVR